jgi:hypothetical protein
MGSEVADEPSNELGIDVVGESALKKVDVFRNGDLHKRYAPRELAFRTHLKIDSDPGSFWHVRVTQQDNHVAWSSPIWLD